MNKSPENEVKIKPHKPDLKEKLFFFLSGMIVSIPITLFFDALAQNFNLGLSNFYAAIIYVVILTPFIEEFAKAYPLFYRHGETERSIFILGLLTGAGFGLSEFFIYTLAFGVPAYIRLPGILFHAASTSIVAYGIAKNQAVKFYLVAVALHLSNNFFALFYPEITIFLAINIVTYYLSWHFYNKTLDKFADINYSCTVD